MLLLPWRPHRGAGSTSGKSQAFASALVGRQAHDAEQQFHEQQQGSTGQKQADLPAEEMIAKLTQKEQSRAGKGSEGEVGGRGVLVPEQALQQRGGCGTGPIVPVARCSGASTGSRAAGAPRAHHVSSLRHLLVTSCLARHACALPDAWRGWAGPGSAQSWSRMQS